MTPDEVARLELAVSEFRRENSEDHRTMLAAIGANAKALVGLNGRMRSAETFKARAEGAVALAAVLLSSCAITAIIIAMVGR